jgi:hypothetical protein
MWGSEVMTLPKGSKVTLMLVPLAVPVPVMVSCRVWIGINSSTGMLSSRVKSWFCPWVMLAPERPSMLRLTALALPEVRRSKTTIPAVRAAENATPREVETHLATANRLGIAYIVNPDDTNPSPPSAMAAK